MEAETGRETKSSTLRTVVIDLIIAVAMLVMSFLGIAATDVSAEDTRPYWALIVVIFAVGSYWYYWRKRSHVLGPTRAAVATVLHWGAVLAALQVMNVLIDAGRIDDPSVGLVNGIMLGLGTFLAGVHLNWRMMVIGAVLMGAAVGVALVEEYLWVLFGLAVATIVVLVVGTRFQRRGRDRDLSAAQPQPQT